MDSNTSPGEADLLRRIRSCPIIDNHAHPLLKKAVLGNHQLSTISTEAHGTALNASLTGLPHLRAVKQLSAVLGCDCSWDAVTAAVEKRRATDYETWIRTCLSGIHCVLVDDGLGTGNETEPYNQYDQFTPAAAKRIVRVEHVAAGLIEEACASQEDAKKAFAIFTQEYKRSIAESNVDPNVVGFKSVICYRTGLDIAPAPEEQEARSAFETIHRNRRKPGANAFIRIAHNGLNEYIVHCLASLIRDSVDNHKKPIQFHTGLGDNDITLTRASPAHLQNFIRCYPTVPIVLLHSGYPFVRESAYLAAMYTNVYSDIGEVFPMLSRDGQESVVRETLEICPSSKILWSTDGHYFPETYLLAVIQMREAFEHVLCEYVRKGDLTWSQAIELIENILFHNSNKLYNLALSIKPLPSAQQHRSKPLSPNSSMLATLLSLSSSALYLRICWVDLTATVRVQVIPMRRALDLLQSNGELHMSVAKASLGVVQTDELLPGLSAAGEWNLFPDFTTLRVGPRTGHLITFGNFVEKDGTPVSVCPRTLLQNTLNLADQQGLSFLLGFEIEFVLLRRTGPKQYEELDEDGHAWCVAGAMDHNAVATVVEGAIAKLDEAGIYVEVVHPESASGQFEIVLPKASALTAVDTLLYAREVISCCAKANGYKMTLHPKPVATAAGTAAHVHMSISSPNGSDPKVYESFYAGILKHLRGILAYTCSNLASYERIVDGCWAGGTWVTWGTENREAPLRKIQDSHWELKAMDGLANPYLAMSAILASGINGVKASEKMRWKECDTDPSSLSEKHRTDLNITEKLPSSLPEALDSLRGDKELCRLLGDELVEKYIATKEAEMRLLNPMNKIARKQWIIERY